MLKLNNLKSPKGATHKTKRIGRGQASGQGTQAGKGHKGQKARAGGGVRTGFEGGAMPLYMRLPKKGFKNSLFRTDYAEISLTQLENKFTSGEATEVTKDALISAGLIKGSKKSMPVKILANGTLSKKLTFVGIEKFTKGAKTALEKVGCEFK